MTLESAILKNIEKLPDSVKQAVFLYTEFLASHYANSSTETTDSFPQNQPLAGSMKGTFVLPLTDDFNESLEDFKDYM